MRPVYGGCNGVLVYPRFCCYRTIEIYRDICPSWYSSVISIDSSKSQLIVLNSSELSLGLDSAI